MSVIRLPWIQAPVREEDRGPEDWERPCAAERKLHELMRTGEVEEHDIGPGVSEIHWAPVRELKLVPIQPVWSSELPSVAGLYLIRQAGAHRNTWRVVDVGRDRFGMWLAHWDGFGPVQLGELKAFQFSKIAEPVED